jgi:hypothetical protein
LPEGLSRAAQDQVRGSGSGSFDPSRNRGQFAKGFENQMDVIGHNHPGEQIVKPVLVGSMFKGFGNDVGDTWIF